MTCLQLCHFSLSIFFIMLSFSLLHRSITTFKFGSNIFLCKIILIPWFCRVTFFSITDFIWLALSEYLLDSVWLCLCKCSHAQPHVLHTDTSWSFLQVPRGPPLNTDSHYFILTLAYFCIHISFCMYPHAFTPMPAHVCTHICAHMCSQMLSHMNNTP